MMKMKLRYAGHVLRGSNISYSNFERFGRGKRKVSASGRI
jgi:hypothetical protein